MIDTDALKRDKRPQSAWVVHALIDRLEAAEKERDFAKTEIARLHDDIRELTDVRVLDAEDRDRIVAWLQGTATKPAPSVPDGLHPLETVRFWADAYTHPGDDNFRGHGMAAALLREYAELRAALPGAQTQPAPSVPDGWLRAIDEALVVANVGVANEIDTYEQAKAKLDSPLGFNVDAATDPAVNGGWKLVPRPPTPTMVKAGLESSHVLNVHRVLACYDAMINAAQCVPSVPECWLPVPEKHPTFDPVDLQLSDGSVLCGCVPQSDGDYWWEGPSGEEVFIDPKYASVTHWRLAAAPEAKP